MIMRMLLGHTGARRAGSFSLLLVTSAVAAVLLPLTLAAGAVSTLLRRNRRAGTGSTGAQRAARFGVFAGTYLRAEITGLCRLARLPASDQDAHYTLLTDLLDLLYRTARRVFHLRVLPPEQGARLPAGPLLVFSRHAGPGDSFLLVYGLLTVARRRPRVVLKETLTLDPLIDILLSRTPNCFVGRGEQARAEAAERISDLSSTLGPRDALLLFPEGGNFTTARRRRLIARLWRQRAWRALPTASSLEHVLPPRSSGVFAAVDAAPPDASVVFVAHTGLDRYETPGAVWRAVPLRRPVELAWWAVPVTDVPRGEQERIAWLEHRWSLIDAWIDRHNGGAAADGAVADDRPPRDAGTVRPAPSLSAPPES